MSKFQTLPSQKLRKKYDLKSCSRRHCGPAEAMPKFHLLNNLEEKIDFTYIKNVISVSLDRYSNPPPFDIFLSKT